MDRPPRQDRRRRRRPRSSTSTTCRISARKNWARCCSRRLPAVRRGRQLPHPLWPPARRPARSSIPPTFTPVNPATGADNLTPQPAASTAPATGVRRSKVGHRAQSAGRGRQGQQHAAHRRDAAEYSVIEAALRKLDVPQRQVMMEVTIAEVTLKDEIEFGVDWLFKGGAPSGRGSGGSSSARARTGQSGLLRRERAATIPVLKLAQGFTYIINNTNFPGGIQAVLAAARHLRQHQGHRQSAPRRARQPEGDDQVRRPDPHQPADQVARAARSTTS